jgi:hypothetical protein
MSTITSTPHIPPPPGFVGADEWQTTGADMPYRIVFGADRTVTDHPVHACICAFQFADDSIEAPGVAVLNPDGYAGLYPLDSDQARELAAVLLAAADQLDGLATR